MAVSRNTLALTVDRLRGNRHSDAAATDVRIPPIAIADSCAIHANVSLAKLTSFRVGGQAQWFVTPRSVEELQRSLQWAEAEGLPVTFLGAGSNLLVSDQGIAGLTIAAKELRLFQRDDERGQVTIGAGEPLPRVAWKLAKMGWSGFEWVVGIPGTIGGAVVMNAGAHQSCVADNLISIETLNSAGDRETLTREELQYSYRTSRLQHDPRLVLNATFQFEPGHDPQTLKIATNHHLHHRHTTQPYTRPSCGSVFRNPESHSAGWLIEHCNLKGFQLGGAEVSEQHANFILNGGNATATDIFQLIHHVRSTVHDQWSVWLHPEVKTIGEFPTL
jgi:UDP-N-acetylmuramate dehydrogenase